MKVNFLLPHKYKYIGYILLAIGIIFISTSFLSIYNFKTEPAFLNFKVLSILDYGNPFHPEKKTFFMVIQKNISLSLTLILFILGGLFIVFSKEKVEDEFISKLRLESMIWAFLVNFLVLLLCVIFIYGPSFMYVVGLNMFTPLLFFIIRFNFLKLKSRSHEE